MPMTTKFTIIILTATMVLLTSGLITIPAQNASPQGGISVHAGRVSVDLGVDRLSVSLGERQATAR
ncbi:MAG: hypothetical protein ACJ72J_08725 [Nitrososphaeraceae archaeon]